MPRKATVPEENRSVSLRSYYANLEKARARHRENQKRFYQKHRKRLRAEDAVRWREHGDQMKARSRELHQLNPEKYRAKWRAMYHADVEKSRKKQRETAKKYAMKMRAWRLANQWKLNAIDRQKRAANPELWKQKKRAWIAKNLDKHRLQCAMDREKRRARKLGAAIGDLALVRAYYKKLREAKRVICTYCRHIIPKGRRTVDHVMPLSRGGAHDVSNFTPACLSCNSAKHDRTPEEFRALRELELQLRPRPRRHDLKAG
jgi:5-methylcytosine-specific restriction endonuclease McrA